MPYLEPVIFALAITMLYFGMKTRGLLFFILSGFAFLFLGFHYSEELFVLFIFIGAALGVTFYGIFKGGH